MKSSYGRTNYEKLRRMSIIAILTAIVIALQIICTFVKFGMFSIPLALAPIIIGGALYGIGVGAFLGSVFGLVVLFTGLLGWDGGTVIYLFGQNAIATVLLCILKGAAAGAAAALIYKLISKRSEIAAVIAAGIVCPIVNTGLFIAGMCIFFMSSLEAWATGYTMIYYLIFILAGGNFAVEFITNLLFSSAITRVISIRKKN